MCYKYIFPPKRVTETQALYETRLPRRMITFRSAFFGGTQVHG